MTSRRTPTALLWLLAWLALSLAALWLLRDLPWRSIAAQLAGQRLRWTALAVLANLLVLPLWALEWWRLAPSRERPGPGRSFEVVALTSATMNTIPFFAGEASAVVLLVTRAGLSHAGALSVLALDQLLVGVAKLTVLGAAALLAPLPLALRTGVMTLGASVVLGGFAMIMLAWSEAGGGWVPASPSAARVITFVRAWAARLEVLREPRGLALVLGLALAKKALEIGAILAAQQALGVALPWWSGVLVVAALGVGTLVPLAPANLGTYEATAFLAYRYLGVPADTALGLAMLHHLAFLVPAIGTGWCVLLLRQLAAFRARPEDVAASTARS